MLNELDWCSHDGKAAPDARCLKTRMTVSLSRSTVFDLSRGPRWGCLKENACSQAIGKGASRGNPDDPSPLRYACSKSARSGPVRRRRGDSPKLEQVTEMRRAPTGGPWSASRALFGRRQSYQMAEIQLPSPASWASAGSHPRPYRRTSGRQRRNSCPDLAPPAIVPC